MTSSERHPAGHLRDPRSAGRGGHGRGLPRPRPQARPRGRDQGPPGGVRARRQPRRAVRARGAHARRGQPPRHRRDLRRRGRRRHPLHRHGARGGRHAGRAPGAGPLPVRDALRIARADRRGARGRPREGRHPPRPEAGEHQDHARERGQGPRLRPGQGDGAARTRGDMSQTPDARLGDSRPGRHRRHPRVHEPRAGARQGDRQAHGHLGVRLPALRDAVGQARLHGRDRARRPGRDPPQRPGLGGASRRASRSACASCCAGASRRTRAAGCATPETRGSSSSPRSPRCPRGRAPRRASRGPPRPTLAAAARRRRGARGRRSSSSCAAPAGAGSVRRPAARGPPVPESDGQRPRASSWGSAMVDTVSARLANVPGLQVVTPRAAIEADCDPHATSPSVARRLGRTPLLAGTLQRENERFRITYWLLDAERETRSPPARSTARSSSRCRTASPTGVVARPSTAPGARRTPTSSGLDTTSEQERYLAGDRPAAALRQARRRRARRADPGDARRRRSPRPPSSRRRSAAPASRCSTSLTTRPGRIARSASSDAARALDPSLPEVDITEGYTLLATGRPEQAVAVFSRRCAANPGTSKRFSGLGRRRAVSATGAAAEVALLKAWRSNRRSRAANSLGAFYADSGQWDKAAQHVPQALQVWPDSSARSATSAAF